MQREKICAVLGLARTGIPAARFLAERGAQVVGYDDRSFEELSDEARALQELGVELRVGPDHNFAGLEECTLIVLSPGLKIHHEPLKSVLARCEAHGAEVIGELEMAARHCPAPMIAVTGTKGKSTTVKLIEEMLRACGIDAVRCGNTGIPLIAELPRLSSQSWAVVEVSSFQLEKAPTLKPRVAVLLNLLEDHQDYHPSLEQYWATKLKLFANQDENDAAVFNCSDAKTEDFALTCGCGIGSELRYEWNGTKARQFKTSGQELPLPDAQEMGVCGRDGFLGWNLEYEFVPVIEYSQIPLRGSHNHDNVAAALAAVYAVLGEKDALINREVIAGAIRNFQSLPHRLEIVGEVGGITYVNDSQATIPEAAMRALLAFPAPVTLIAGGRAKLENADAFDALGRAVAANAHGLVTIGEAAQRLEEAARRAGMADEKIVRGQELTKAVELATMATPQGGTIVLSPACASFDQFSSYEARGEAFRQAVERLKQRKNC
ncbi:MAG TPA: UDP-N-acetylmuramoyl-L-alanine--D-glutamate ligase [Abditibacteriaceae bacterium]